MTTAVKDTIRDVSAGVITVKYVPHIISLVLADPFPSNNSDITPRFIESHLSTNAPRVLLFQDLPPPSPSYTEKGSSQTREQVFAPPLDILVRTSDVRRLSDFLMWQVRPLISPLSLAQGETRDPHLCHFGRRHRGHNYIS